MTPVVNFFALLFLLSNFQFVKTCDLHYPSAVIKDWPADSFSVVSHAEPLGFWSRRWYSCTKQLADLEEMMEHGTISIPSCISTTNKLCATKKAWVYSACLSKICDKGKTHEELKKRAESDNNVSVYINNNLKTNIINGMVIFSSVGIMGVLIWIAVRYFRKRSKKANLLPQLTVQLYHQQ